MVTAVAFSPDGKTVVTGELGRARRGSGTRPPAAHRRTARRHTRAVSTPWRSAPTARPSLTGSCGQDGAALGRGHRPAHRHPDAAPGRGQGRGLQPRRQDRRSPAVRTRRRGSGTPPPASPSGHPHGARRRGLVPWPSAPTARPSLTGSDDNDGAALGRGHRRAHRRRRWQHQASVDRRGLQPRRQDRRSPAAGTRRRGSGTPPPARPSAPLQRPRGPGHAVAFSPDGKTLAIGQHRQYARRFWNVPTPLAGDAERIVLWTQTLVVMELDASDASQVLDCRDWERRRQKLEELGGLPGQISHSPETPWARHLRDAESSEKVGRWFERAGTFRV